MRMEPHLIPQGAGIWDEWTATAFPWVTSERPLWTKPTARSSDRLGVKEEEEDDE